MLTKQEQKNLKPMGELTVEELRTLYFNYVSYREKFCGGRANLESPAFYRKYGLKPYTH